MQNTSASDLLDLSTGAVDGSFPLVDDFGYVTQESDGDFLYSARRLRRDDEPERGGALQVRVVGDPAERRAHRGGVRVLERRPGGRRDPTAPSTPRTRTTPSRRPRPTGDLARHHHLGRQPPSSADGGFYLVGSTFYFQGGPVYNDGGDNISSISLSTLQAELDAVHRPDDTLGWGAGLTTSATGNYFAAGTTPSVDATFDSWWTGQASHLQLHYSVENTASLDAETRPGPNHPLLADHRRRRSPSIPLTLPAADEVPGPYLVQASLFDTSTSPPTRLGTTCLPYTVGATGDGLDFATLPSGVGAGGPSRPAGSRAQRAARPRRLPRSQRQLVHLPPQLLGVRADRGDLCGRAAMTFADAPTSYYQAAATALADHVTYWVQVSNGDSISMALVEQRLLAGGHRSARPPLHAPSRPGAARVPR